MKVTRQAIGTRRGAWPFPALQQVPLQFKTFDGPGLRQEPVRPLHGKQCGRNTPSIFCLESAFAQQAQNGTGTWMGRNPGSCPCSSGGSYSFTWASAQVAAERPPTGRERHRWEESQLPRPLYPGSTCGTNPASGESVTCLRPAHERPEL